MVPTYLPYSIPPRSSRIINRLAKFRCRLLRASIQAVIQVEMVERDAAEKERTRERVSEGWKLLSHDRLENQICRRVSLLGGSGPAGCLLETPTASTTELSEVRWAGSFLSKTIPIVLSPFFLESNQPTLVAHKSRGWRPGDLFSRRTSRLDENNED